MVWLLPRPNLAESTTEKGRQLSDERGGARGWGRSQIIRQRKAWSSISHSILPTCKGRHPGPHEGHELAKKLIILVVTVPYSIGGAGRHPGPHEGHELAKKLIILVVTVPDGIGGAGRHPGPDEGHELANKLIIFYCDCTL
jgi:hypothetical protein